MFFLELFLALCELDFLLCLDPFDKIKLLDEIKLLDKIKLLDEIKLDE